MHTKLCLCCSKWLGHSSPELEVPVLCLSLEGALLGGSLLCLLKLQSMSFEVSFLSSLEEENWWEEGKRQDSKGAVGFGTAWSVPACLYHKGHLCR